MKPQAFARALLAWYDRDRRDLPWRRQPSPYRTLVSELMLQQTVVATVVPYFGRFVARWPDWPALASAREDDVLAMWSGLGYYSRARNLHRVARAVMDSHGGVLPRDEDVLRSLPGIGPYTAAAVAAIAFDAPAFALDGNVARVVARVAGVREAIDLPATRTRLRGIGQAWVPARRAGDFAQALMELGALVCTPRSPTCAACPVAAACVARRDRSTAEIPVRSPRRPKREVRMVCARLRDAGGTRVLLVKTTAGLLAGTWMLPARVLGAGEGAAQAAREVAKQAGAARKPLVHVGQVRHLFTHRDVTADVFETSVAGASADAPPGGDTLWADEPALRDLAVSTFLRRLLEVKRSRESSPSRGPTHGSAISRKAGQRGGQGPHAAPAVRGGAKPHLLD